MVKLISLRIQNYKNFIDTIVDFQSPTNYCAIIGLNSSGKSNLLEAISIIFAGIYNKKVESINSDYNTELKFEIVYKIENIEIKVSTISTVHYKTKNIDNLDFYRRSKAVFYNGNHVPSQIITNYSGEELRLWEDIYEDFYKTYFNTMKSSDNIIDKKMMYINKFNWQMALVTLLSYGDNIILDMLNIGAVEDVNIKLTFDMTKYTTYSVNQIIEFIDEINPDRKDEETIDLLSLRLNNVLNRESDNKQKHINLFDFLYVAYMPKDYKIIKDIEIEFNDINSRSLSEGEKKIILIRLITTILADDKTLLIFDEPDSHLHVSRKKELADIIKNSSQYSILTTHSPALISFLEDDSIKLLRPDVDDGVKCEEAEKFKHIELLTDSSISLLDTSLIISTTKHILMCEGVNDIYYIKKAIEVLSRTKDTKYLKLSNIVMINCGGADNVQAVFEEIVKDNLNPNQKCNIIFDDDGTGRACKGNIQKIIDENTLSNVQTFTHPKIPNWNTTDFYMEDYFSVNAYKSDIIAKFNSGHNLQTLNQNIDVKKLIKANYTNNQKFQDQHFDNFTVILDKLFDLFELEES